MLFVDQRAQTPRILGFGSWKTCEQKLRASIEITE